ncbi:MAG: class II aldolase, partial [Alphaproteobacteria bacterium]|nr:class II aldolase [Alphaproteobacteria bacterium]
DAFMRLYYLERACTYQVRALSAGRENMNMPNQGVSEHTAGQTMKGFDGPIAKISWPALMRILDRTNPGYDA